MAIEQATPTTLQHISLARRGATYFEMSGPGEFIAAAVLFALMLVIRIVNILHYRFDSDEPQHLHVIWGWARGFIQYRDLFDNHMPLFHIMFAPIFGLIGDRATILYEMRFVLLPMYFVAAWCTYKIGATLFPGEPVSGLLSSPVFIPAIILFRSNFERIIFGRRSGCCVLRYSHRLADCASRSRCRPVAWALFRRSMKSVLFLLSIAVAALLTLLLVGRRNLGPLLDSSAGMHTPLLFRQQLFLQR